MEEPTIPSRTTKPHPFTLNPTPHPVEQHIGNVLDPDNVLIGGAHPLLEVGTEATVEEDEFLQAREQLLSLVAGEDVLLLKGDLVQLWEGRERLLS